MKKGACPTLRLPTPPPAEPLLDVVHGPGGGGCLCGHKHRTTTGRLRQHLAGRGAITCRQRAAPADSAARDAHAAASGGAHGPFKSVLKPVGSDVVARTLSEARGDTRRRWTRQTS
eukprot:1535102-Rhodomonas_salina.1